MSIMTGCKDKKQQKKYEDNWDSIFQKKEKAKSDTSSSSKKS